MPAATVRPPCVESGYENDEPIFLMASQRAWVRMPSGKRLDLLNPTPFDWDDADLALGLARTYRWGGHSAWPLPLSVAQHSITVMLLQRAALGRIDPLLELRELLHDAEEGLLGFDHLTAALFELLPLLSLQVLA